MENIFNLDFARIISYGLSGISVIFSFFAVYLLKKEQEQPKPRPVFLKAIQKFILSTIVMAVIIGIFSLPVLSRNQDLKAAVNMAEEIQGSFSTISATDSSLIEFLRKENQQLRNQILHNQQNSSREPQTLINSLERQVELLNNLSALTPVRGENLHEIQGTVANLQATTERLKRTNPSSLSSAEKKRIEQEVSKLQQSALQLPARITSSERLRLDSNIVRFNKATRE